MTSPAVASVVDVVRGANALIDAITFDDSGLAGRGGNGGLISRETIRKADELRLILSHFDPDQSTPQGG